MRRAVLFALSRVLLCLATYVMGDLPMVTLLNEVLMTHGDEDCVRLQQLRHWVERASQDDPDRQVREKAMVLWSCGMMAVT